MTFEERVQKEQELFNYWVDLYPSTIMPPELQRKIMAQLDDTELEYELQNRARISMKEEEQLNLLNQIVQKISLEEAKSFCKKQNLFYQIIEGDLHVWINQTDCMFHFNY